MMHCVIESVLFWNLQFVPIAIGIGYWIFYLQSVPLELQLLQAEKIILKTVKHVYLRMRLILIILLSCSVALAQDPYKNIYSSHAWKERDAWQKPGELIKLMNIQAGSQVADIGCHEGYMSYKLSKVVGDKGKVYAVDVDQSKLDKLKKSVEESATKNISVVRGEYDNPKLPDNALDAVIILDTYHEMDDHDKILEHIRAALKPGGKLLLCEPIAEQRRNLKRSEQEGKHELGMNFALDDLEKAGFKISFQKDPYIDRTKEKGDKMWVVVAVKE